MDKTIVPVASDSLQAIPAAFFASVIRLGFPGLVDVFKQNICMAWPVNRTPARQVLTDQPGQLVGRRPLACNAWEVLTTKPPAEKCHYVGPACPVVADFKRVAIFAWPCHYRVIVRLIRYSPPGPAA